VAARRARPAPMPAKRNRMNYLLGSKAIKLGDSP
jgi:hypothetical protein